MKTFSIGSRFHDAELAEPLVNLSEITEIELLILRRMQAFTMGDHRSVFTGAGFDFVGLRDWQPGDRLAAIDWSQSTLTNFSPLVIREFEQYSNAAVVIVADRSASTRCGIDGRPIAAGVARAIATIGLSAVVFQDVLGLITFEGGFERMTAVRPRIGKNHVIYCLEAYQRGTLGREVKPHDSLATTLAGHLRKTCLVPVVSDFLFEGVPEALNELSTVNSVHDVVLVMIDSAFAFELPEISAGWVETYDIETGRSRLISRRTLRKLAQRTREWQEEVERLAKDADLDLIRLSIDARQSEIALLEFVVERRLRKRR